MPSQAHENMLSFNERKIVVELLGMVARVLEANGIECKHEIFDIYQKLGGNPNERRNTSGG